MAIRIETVNTQRLHLRLRRPLAMSFGTISEQHVLLVRLRDADGAEGVGEACVMGGPYWNADTIEGTQAVVARYAAPHLRGAVFDDLFAFSQALGRLFRGNGAARTALEMAFLDLAGKRLDLPAARLLGEPQRRDRIAVAWTLPSGPASAAVAEGEEAIARRGHGLFKIKVGVAPLQDELAFARALARVFDGRARLLIDANQAWSAHEAPDILARFHDAGVAVAEQPIGAHDLQGMARLARECAMPVLADEALTGPAWAQAYADAHAVAGFALKPQRDGGLVAALQTARIAARAGLACYGGTMLETSLGTAAMAALYSVVPELGWGCELFGPLRLDGDIARGPLAIRDGALELPTGPGLGVTLDEDRIAYLAARAC